MLVEVATVDDVDSAALALLGRATLDDAASAFLLAWEAWGIWANGSFEAVLTGALADEGEAVVSALEGVGGTGEAQMFKRAIGLVHGDVDQRMNLWTSAVAQEAAGLDNAMMALPDFKQSVLVPFLDRHPHLRAT